MNIGKIMAFGGMAAVLGFSGLSCNGQPPAVQRQDSGVSRLEQALETATPQPDVASQAALQPDDVPYRDQYVLLGEPDLTRLAALVSVYNAYMRGALGAPHDVNAGFLVTNEEGLGVRLYFATHNQMGGTGPAPLWPPTSADVARAAYGGKPYVADLGGNITNGRSPIKLEALPKTSEPSGRDYLSVFMAPKE